MAPAAAASLSKETKAVLKATAPVLREHGEAITMAFYSLLMSRYPQARNLFNMSHQRPLADGEPSPQARSLANSVIAYAANCDRLEVLGEAVERIAHKHVSFDVLPEQYPWVGECLIDAIKSVLGSAATDEVVDGWKDGYAFLADLLIDVEETKKKMQEKNGGWRGFKMLKVVGKEKETDEITSFTLKQTDGGAVPDNFKAGQYLAFRIPKGQVATGGGADHDLVRNYSLSNAPGNGCFRVSIKRETGDGDGSVPAAGVISNYFHDRINVGSEVQVAMPCGSFVLDTSAENRRRPVMLLAAGVGLTPMISMLDAIVEGNDDDDSRHVVYVQVARSPRHHAMAKHVDEMAGKCGGGRMTAHAFYTSADADSAGLLKNTTVHDGRLSCDALRAICEGGGGPTDYEYYFCGPQPFLDATRALLAELGVASERAHYEYFGPTP